MLNLFIKKTLSVVCLSVSIFAQSTNAMAELGFVNLPQEGFKNSAYIDCNTTGEFGLKQSTPPTVEANNDCAVYRAALIRDVMKSPILGYKLLGISSKSAVISDLYAAQDNDIGTVTDTVWRSEDNNFCIYGTHVQLKELALRNGMNFEVNDIARAGFAGRPVEVAYFYSNNPQALPQTESVFRVGRTFTSVRYTAGDLTLPELNNAPAANTAISNNQSAAVSDNWVTFTTDVNPNDPDGTSYPFSATLYVKTTCSAAPPMEVEGAIRLRSTGQNGQPQIEINVPGFIPPNAVVDKY